jgi:FixJ family two-component response regulator
MSAAKDGGLSVTDCRLQLRLIVVDDDQGVRRALARFLRSCGHDVRVYPSAEAYLEEPGGDVDCCIFDLELPGLGGLELGVRLGPATPIVFITAHDHLARVAHQQTRQACLMKPIDEAHLLDAIERATLVR